MNEVIKEWLAKAEGDFGTAQRELNVPQNANYDAVCFYAQQCIEKTMKAVLTQEGIVPPKTHDLFALSLVLPAFSILNAKDLRLLTHAAASFRYPGESADETEAAESFEACLRVRTILMAQLRDVGFE